MTDADTDSATTSDTTGAVSVSDTDTGPDPDTSTGEPDDTTGDASSTGEGCIPAPEICNGIDDDCDGLIDNVDEGGDGICDCLRIALVGNKGANPSAEFETWLEDQGTSVDRINTNVNEPLNKEVLLNYDIIILDWLVRTYTVEEADTVRSWVEQGGGLMAMTGHTNNQTVAMRPNSLLAPMGLSYNTSAGFFSGPVVSFVPHPITEGLTSITFLGGLFIDIVDDNIGQNQVIMTLPPGPVGVTQDRGQGSMFVFGDEWIEFDSEWQNQPQIKQLWVQILSYIGPKDSCLLPQ